MKDRVLKPRVGMLRIGDRTGRNHFYSLKPFISKFFRTQYGLDLVDHGPSSTSTNNIDVFHLMSPECLTCARKIMHDASPNWGLCWVCHVEIHVHMQIPNSQGSVEQTCTYYDVVEDGGQKYITYGNEMMSYWAIEGVKGNNWKLIQPSPNIWFDISRWPWLDKKDLMREHL